jgi:hypothetical protein
VLASLPAACALLLTLLAGSPASAAPQKVAGGIQFTYKDPNAGSVAWAGLFNNWSPTANPMKRGSDGVWSVVVALPPGEQQYKFVVDTQWFADPENGTTAGEFGNSVVTVANDGSLVAKQATSNTPYSPKIFMGGRVIGEYQEIYNPSNTRYELTRPTMDLDLGFDVRFSDVLAGHFLMNINPEHEDVQDYRSRLNFKRGSLTLSQPDLKVFAFDSEALPEWNDMLHLVGDVGVFHHPYGYQRQGFQVSTPKLGFDTQILYTDNFNNNGTEFPDFIINRGTGRQFVFDSDPVNNSLNLLQTVRTISGFALAPDQITRIASMDAGDNDNSFGFGDGNKNTFAGRVRRALPHGVTLGLLGRSDRGYNLGRVVFAQPTGDSTVSVLSGQYETEWYGGGGDATWAPVSGLSLRGEYLQGAERFTLVNGATQQEYKLGSITATGVGNTSTQPTTAADGQHRTLDRSSRFGAGAAWTFAKGDITLRAGFERENHAYPAWTQSPVAVAGLGPEDHPHFENISYARNSYLRASEDIENSRTEYRLGWDRNWRYYLNRELKTTVDLEVTHFEYDARTSWDHQLWLPTGNFWLERGQHQVGIDRLTVLGVNDVVRLKPTLEVPFWARRNALLRYQGTFTGVDLGKNPRYAESIFQLGFDWNKVIRIGSDTRWVKYDAPTLGLARGYASTFTSATYHFAPDISVALGLGVDPEVLDPNTNEYSSIGRDLYLNQRNANGYIAENNYLSLAPQIAAAEHALKAEKRIQLRAVVHF